MNLRKFLTICLSLGIATAVCQNAFAQQDSAAATPNDEAPSPATAATDAKAAPAAPSTSTPPPEAAQQSQASFDAKFNEYKSALRDIEKLRTEYQSADAVQRKKLNEQLTGQVAHAQSLVNGLVDAAQEAYRLAPNADPRVTDLLASVVVYNVAGHELKGHTSQISGGDQYEKALPIIKLLSEGGADIPELPVWGFLSAVMVNDYDLADKYLNQGADSGAFQKARESKDAARKQAVELAMNFVQSLPQYKQMWAKEAKIREAEAAADDLPRVKLTTTKGEITLELFENEAPQTVANFLTLVKQGFYDGSPFHRVIAGFMAQGGAKGDDGSGGPGYTIDCECYRPDARNHFRGSLSMAHAGKDTGNSQFFLTFAPTGHLDGKHTVFGRVIDGMEVLGDITRRNPQEAPPLPQPDRIIKAEVLRDRGHEYKFEKHPE